MRRKILPWSVAALLAAGCEDSDYPLPPDQDIPQASKDSGAETRDGGAQALLRCRPVQGQAGPARAAIMGAITGGGSDGSKDLLTVEKLYADFAVNKCATCHGNVSLPMGNLLASSLEQFKQNVTQDSVERLRTTDLTKIMPLGERVTLAERDQNHPLVLFTKRLEAWLVAGKPDSLPDPVAAYDVPAEQPAPKIDAPFAVSTSLGSALSNMGSCVPAKEIVSSAVEPMDRLDAAFAAMTQHGDLPKKLSQTDLFTLDSEKLAEQGVISFAPGYTLWADNAKKMRYVRVPRGQSIQFSVGTQSFDIPDNTRFYKTFLKEVKDANGNVGYRKMETRIIVARRAQEEAGNPMPKINALFGSYQWNEDESEATLVTEPYRDGTPFRDVVSEYVKDEALFATLQAEGNEFTDYFAEGAKRHYAIPGADRCVQCHMGQDSFVLGFLPLQIMRRPVGEGGVIEPAETDELNQLERLIDYGLITGLNKDEIARRIVPLEKSQGERLPRNQYELEAQGYMLGNCAHCHNPLGYPTRTAPVLKDVLDFMPSPRGGGVFQFPLERVSPRTRRSMAGTVIDVPYITPSTYDLGSRGAKIPYAWFDETGEVPLEATTMAPWRSLIYRNVQSGFTYSDGSTIYPHMPLHTAGRDCRAPEVMAKWMLSIPSVDVDRDGAPHPRADLRAQPFVEVRPEDENYWLAAIQADARLQRYLKDPIHSECSEDADVIDPNSLDEELWERSVLKALGNPDFAPFQVPNRSSWVPLDTHTSSEKWAPRGAFDRVLVQEDVSGYASVEGVDLREEQRELIRLLKTMRRDDAFKQMALAPQPLGVWVQKPECNFAGVPTVATTPAAPEYSFLKAKPAETPIYMQSPGGAIFGMICVNCHGATFEANGRQSTIVSDLTGGSVSVANFKVGLFGPPGMVDENRKALFGRLTDASNSEHDWAARYMAWMALGGTTAKIPVAVLQVVGDNPVLEQKVARGVTASPNMLEVAKVACAAILPQLPAKLTAVSTAVGDYAVWRRVCTHQNAFPVRVFEVTAKQLENGIPVDYAATLRAWAGDSWPLVELYERSDSFRGLPFYDLYSGQPVLGVGPEVQEPACVIVTEATDVPLSRAQLEALYLAKRLPLPLCAPAADPRSPGVAALRWDDAKKTRWKVRGAVNAGFAVYSYIDAVTRGEVKPPPDYDRCDQLSMSAP